MTSRNRRFDDLTEMFRVLCLRSNGFPKAPTTTAKRNALDAELAPDFMSEEPPPAIGTTDRGTKRVDDRSTPRKTADVTDSMVSLRISPTKHLQSTNLLYVFKIPERKNTLSQSVGGGGSSSSSGTGNTNSSVASPGDATTQTL